MKTVNALKRFIRFSLAPYVVIDSYGTVQVEWSLNAAMEWLPYTSSHTMIWNRWSGMLVASRISFPSGN